MHKALSFLYKALNTISVFGFAAAGNTSRLATHICKCGVRQKMQKVYAGKARTATIKDQKKGF